MPIGHLGHETKASEVKWVSPLALDSDTDGVQKSAG